MSFLFFEVQETHSYNIFDWILRRRGCKKILGSVYEPSGTGQVSIEVGDICSRKGKYLTFNTENEK